MVRRHHQEALAQGLAALKAQESELQEIFSAILAVDPSNLPKVKTFLAKLQRRAAIMLEEGRPSEVYRLNIQLIPLTRSERGKSG